jgi:hypothetical protein
MHFFPPQDAPPHGAIPSSHSESEPLNPKPLPFSLSNYLGAVPGLVLMFVFAPLLLILFTWQRAREKKGH